MTDKPKSFSKVIVSLVIMLNVIFTVAVLYIFYHTGVEPVVTVGAWFSFTTAELWVLGTIKKKEITEENKIGEYDE